MTTATHKLNVMVNGDKVSQTEFVSYESMMDAARAIRDEVADANPGGFVVAQYQIARGDGTWRHGAILS